MRFGVAALLMFSLGCGDPIQVGNASDKRGLEEDRQLADQALQIVGSWEYVLGPGSLLVVRLELVAGDRTREGTFTMSCVAGLCDEQIMVPQGDAAAISRRVGDWFDGTGTYQLLAVDEERGTIGLLSGGDASLTRFVVPKGARSLNFPVALPVKILNLPEELVFQPVP